MGWGKNKNTPPKISREYKTEIISESMRGWVRKFTWTLQ